MSAPRPPRPRRPAPPPVDPRAGAVTDPRARAVADTRDRFLREIAARVPAERIAELHLFPPLRRGTSETGVAVIASERDPTEALDGGAGEAPVASPGGEPAAEGPRATPRHTVFTARYRLALKGAERGKWDFDLVADADAPLVTVDTVVRGVQRRAGDEEEPERLTAEALRAALDAPPCTGTR